MALSVCFLTRNEEKNLPRALRSVAGVADQVVVADTASTDRTAAIAAELGAEVSQFPWKDDFAAGRNFTIGQATGDWILWLNADEELLPSSHECLRQAMGRPDAFGYFVRLEHVRQADRPEQFSQTVDVRLFRRRRDLAFVGRAHPGFTDAMVEAVRRENQQVLPSEIAVRHHAYLAERSEAKLRWMARLLELELQDRPGQLRYLIEYGQTLLRLNDPRGHAVLAKAVDQVWAARHAPAAPTGKVQVLLEYLLTVPAELSRGPLTSEEARALAVRWFPLSPPMLWVAAGHYFRGRDYRQAAELLERLVHLGKTGAHDLSRNFDPAIVGEDALMNLAACYGQLCVVDGAENCWRQLLHSPKYQAQAAQHLSASQKMRGQAGAFSFSFDVTR
jgi:hypothetical protein